VTDLAVCICTRNRPAELRRALESVRGSTALLAQVVVSDDSDMPDAEATVSVCAEFSGVTYLTGPRRGLAANRNHCLNHLDDRIELVVFIDDDAVLRTDFLERARAILEHDRGSILTGCEHDGNQRVCPRNRSFWGLQERLPRGPGDYHAVCMNAALFPRALFDRVRFDEALLYGYEEADIAAQAEAAGYRIRFSPELVNDHRRSPVNRDEYAAVQDASRLYATFKRYAWLEARYTHAAAFGLLAPFHLLASSVKVHGFRRGIPHAIRSMRAAGTYVVEEHRRRKRDGGGPHGRPTDTGAGV
jgi:GT2 family glycosyltransferase